MRIVSVNVHYQDGLGYQDYYLGLEFTRLGHEVLFVSSDWHFAFPDYDRTVRHILGDPYVGVGVFENNYGAKVHRLPSRLRWSGFIWLSGFEKKIRELKPDLIICHGLLTWQSVRMSLISFPSGTKIVYDDHTHTEVERSSPIARVLYAVYRLAFSRRIYKSADMLIGITPETIPFIRRRLGISGDKVHMIPLGTDTLRYFPDARKRRLYRDELGVKEQDIVVLYTGKIYPEKRVDLILDATRVICDRSPDLASQLVVVLVGDAAASEVGKIEKMMSSASHRVLLKPSVTQEKLADVYNGADLAVWPVSATTSTIDASACGVPVILTNRLPERIQFDNGIGVEPGSMDSLVAALSRLIEDSELRERMGAAGVELVREKLSWAAIANSFLAVTRRND